MISGQNFLIYLYLIHTITLWDHAPEAYKEFQKIDKANRILSNSRKRRLYDLYTHAEFTKLEERFGEAMVFKKIEEEFGNKSRNRSVIDNISVNVLKVGYQSVCC